MQRQIQKEKCSANLGYGKLKGKRNAPVENITHTLDHVWKDYQGLKIKLRAYDIQKQFKN